MPLENQSDFEISQQTLEAKGYHLAIQLAMRVASDRRYPLNEQFVQDLNQRVLFGLTSLNPGKYRSTPAIIRDSLWVAPNWQNIPRAMQNYSRELESRTMNIQKSVFGINYAVETMAWAHNELVVIQPFSDGNNRTADLLVDTISKRAGMYYITDWGDKSGEYVKALKDTMQYKDIGVFEAFLAGKLATRYEEKINILTRDSVGDDSARKLVLRDLETRKNALIDISQSKKNGERQRKSSFATN